MQALTAGANAPLPAGQRVTVKVTSGAGHVDVIALVLDQNRRALDDESVALFSNPSVAGGAVTVDVPNDTVSVALADLPAAAKTVLVVAQADSGPTVAAAGALTAAVAVDGAPAAEYREPSPAAMPTLQTLEIYLHSSGWKVRALGDGYAEGLAKLLTVHGISVDDAPTPAPAATPTPAPAAAAAAPSAPPAFAPPAPSPAAVAPPAFAPPTPAAPAPPTFAPPTPAAPAPAPPAFAPPAPAAAAPPAPTPPPPPAPVPTRPTAPAPTPPPAPARSSSRPSEHPLLQSSRNASQAKFAGVIDREIPSDAKILFAGDGKAGETLAPHLMTSGLPAKMSDAIVVITTDGIYWVKPNGLTGQKKAKFYPAGELLDVELWKGQHLVVIWESPSANWAFAAQFRGADDETMFMWKISVEEAKEAAANALGGRVADRMAELRRLRGE